MKLPVSRPGCHTGTRVVTGSADNTAQIWNVNGSGTPIVLRGHTHEIRRVHFSPDGAHVLTASDDTTARIWRADGTGEPVALRGHTSMLSWATMSPDGKRVATASSDGTARSWNADGSGVPIILQGHTAKIWAVHVSPDGSCVATVSEDQTSRIWPNVSHIPSIDELQEQLWRASSMPVERRHHLLGLSDEAAQDGLLQCRRRIARSHDSPHRR